MCRCTGGREKHTNQGMSNHWRSHSVLVLVLVSLMVTLSLATELPMNVRIGDANDGYQFIQFSSSRLSLDICLSLVKGGHHTGSSKQENFHVLTISK